MASKTSNVKIFLMIFKVPDKTPIYNALLILVRPNNRKKSYVLGQILFFFLNWLKNFSECVINKDFTIFKNIKKYTLFFLF